MKIFTLFALLAALATSNYVAAAVHSVEQDTWLDQFNPNQRNHNSRELLLRTYTRSVVQYDLDAIPTGTEIRDAQAWFWVTQVDNIPLTVDVHRVTQAWNDNSATWANLASAYAARVEDSIVANPSGRWVQVDLTNLVQQWVCGEEANHGIMILGASAGRSRFASDEWRQTARRPYIDVTTGSANACAGIVGHFSISHAGASTTCTPAIIEIQHHFDDHTLNTSFQNTITLSTSSGNGSWGLVAGSGTLTDLGNGTATYRFVAADQGSVQVSLANPNLETVSIDVTSGAASEDPSHDPPLTFSNNINATFRDDFNVESWGNNDGSHPFSNDWQEIGEFDGPSRGDVEIRRGRSELEIQDNDNGGEGVWRSLNLSSFTSANLSLSYRRQRLDGPSDYVALSVYDGTQWHELTRFAGRANDRNFIDYQVDITPYISADTRIRLLGSPTLGGGDRVRFDFLQVDASATDCISTGTNTFSVNHDGQGIHCSAEPMTITATDVNGAVVDDYVGEIVLNTQSGSGSWRLASGAGLFADATANDGIARYRFADADDGQAQFYLDYAEGAPSVSLSIQQSDDANIRDDGSHPPLIFSASGFTVTASALANPPANPISDPLPAQTAGQNFQMHITAYGTSPTNPQCGIIESYQGTKPLDFSTQHTNPSSGPVQATVDGLATQLGAQNVNFVAGQAVVTAKYKDVGELSLTMSDLSGSTPMYGGSNNFISRPADLHIISVVASDGSNNPGTTSATGDGFTFSGDVLRVAVEVLDAEGARTPSFGNETPRQSLSLSSNVLTPSGGRNGSINGIINAASFAQNSPGLFINSAASWDEVGSIVMTAAVTDYLGSGPVSSLAPADVGRFYPSSFVLEADQVIPACGTFTYMDQPELWLSYRLRAVNAAGNTTQNYDAAALGASAVAGVALTAEDSNNGTPLDHRLVAPTHAWQQGIYSVNDMIQFNRLATPDGPYRTLQLMARVDDGLDSRPLQSVDGNPDTAGDCLATNSCSHINLDTATSIYYGRLALRPAYGPENRDLDMGLAAEVFNLSNQGNFAANADDVCTIYNVTGAQLSNYSDNLQAGETSVLSPLSDTFLDAGREADGAPVLLQAPGIGNEGSVNVTLPTDTWLQFDWFGSGETHPQSIATFGRYRGHDRIIYMRER